MTGIDLDLAGIRARAEAATPGPWRTSDEFTRAGAGRFFGPEGKSIVGMATGYYGIRALDDAAHIASADPPTVIAMCDLIEHQAEEIARLKATLAELQSVSQRMIEAARRSEDDHANVWGSANMGRRRVEGMLFAAVTAALTPKEDTPCRTA